MLLLPSNIVALLIMGARTHTPDQGVDLRERLLDRGQVGGVGRQEEHAAPYTDLREAFRVGTYKDIPEARWEEVVVWFRARIVSRRQPPGSPIRRG